MKRSRMVLATSVATLVLLLGVSVLSILNATPAEAASALTISRVWTHGQGQDTTVFTQGEGIQYAVTVNNAWGPLKAYFTFEAYQGKDDYGSKRIYEYSQAHVSVPGGSSNYYSPSTIPAGAPSGSYTVRVVIWAESPAPGNLTDEQTGQFTVS